MDRKDRMEKYRLDKIGEAKTHQYGTEEEVRTEAR